MPIRLSVRGADKLGQLARRLKEYGDKQLRSELFRAINRATRPMKEDVRGAAFWRLPKRGGLNKRVAQTRITTKNKLAGRGVGVRIIGRSGYDIGSIDRGRVRHLTFGHLPWSDQAVRPGFWTEPLKADARIARKEIITAMNTIGKKIERGI